MSELLKNPGHWKARAEEARTLADEMNDEIAKQTMLGIAEDYEVLAHHADLRLKGNHGPRKVSRDTGNSQ